MCVCVCVCGCAYVSVGGGRSAIAFFMRNAESQAKNGAQNLQILHLIRRGEQGGSGMCGICGKTKRIGWICGTLISEIKNAEFAVRTLQILAEFVGFPRFGF